MYDHALELIGDAASVLAVGQYLYARRGRIAAFFVDWFTSSRG